MTKKVSCPTCGKALVWSSENPWRPFCSERCQLIDFGAWADERHVISDPPALAEEADFAHQKKH